MQENKLFGALLPTHPDILPIIEAVRKKYDIPEINPNDEDFIEFLISNEEYDWQAIREEIEQRIRENEKILPPAYGMLYKAIQASNNAPLTFPELAPLDEKTRNSVIAMMMLLLNTIKPIMPALDTMYKVMADAAFEYILTGKTREVPQDWFGQVLVFPSFGENLVMAMAGEFSDPKVIAKEFKEVFARTYGEKPKISKLDISTAEFLNMKLRGKSIRYMVEIYAERHPSEFPKIKNSDEYRQAVSTHRERIKKNIQRLQETINELLGDKK